MKAFSLNEQSLSKKDKKYRKWFKKRYCEVKKIAKKYKRRGHFQKQDRSAYSWAHSHKLLDTFCSHMMDKHQDISVRKEDVRKAANKYNRRSDFQKNDRNFYQKAYVNGWLDEVCYHMPNPRSWLKKEIDYFKILESSLKYVKWSEFIYNNTGAYAALKRHGLFKTLKEEHQKFFGNKTDR